MSLASQITLLAQAIGANIKALTPRLLPSGGTTGQVLSKSSATDYATSWQSAPAPLDPDGYPAVPVSGNVNIVASAGGSLNQLGPGTASAGTLTGPAPTSASYRASLIRSQYVTATSAASTAGPRSSVVNRWRGNAAGLGGFDVLIRFALTLQAGHQCQIGLSTLDLNAEPSTNGSCISLAADAADTNLQWLTRDGTNFNKIDTGVSKLSADVFRVRFVTAANGSSVAALLYNESTGTLVGNPVLSTNLPSSTTFMAVMAKVRNGATTTVAQIDFLRWVSAAGSS